MGRLPWFDQPPANGRNRRNLSLHLAFGEGQVSTPSRPPERVPSVRFDPLEEPILGFPKGELLRKEDHLKSGDSGVAF